jgi:hypothetical protein
MNSGSLAMLLAMRRFPAILSMLILAAWFIEGDGNVDTLHYRDRLVHWCFAKFLTPVSISPVESGPLPFEASESLG